jgi:hypothetical protein
MKTVGTACLLAVGLLAMGCSGELVGGNSLQVLDERGQPLEQYGPGVGEVADTGRVELFDASGDLIQAVDLVRATNDPRWYVLEDAAALSGVGTVEQSLSLSDWLNRFSKIGTCSKPGEVPCGAFVCVGSSDPNAVMYGIASGDTGSCKFYVAWVFKNGKLTIL